MNRITIVQAAIRKLHARSYLEIGVSFGHAFLSIDVEKKIAVDPKNLIKHHPVSLKKDDWILEAKKLYRFLLQKLGKENALFFEVTSDDFFEAEKELLQDRKIDVALVDGLHTYEQVVRDVENCLQYLNPNGVIVLHDCNPISRSMETPAQSFAEADALNPPGWDKLWCGDVWKAIVHLRSFRKDLQVFVLDSDMGIGVVRRGVPEDPIEYSQHQIDSMTYDDLEKNRIGLLNLKSASYFDAFLGSLSKI